ncbi:MAG: ATP-binding protein, partial [Nitrospira sp.]|nr:ATP-binding protein [Nitrospira sp.]
ANRVSHKWWVIAVQPEGEALALVRAVEIWTWIMLGIGLFFIMAQALGSHTKNLKQLVQDKTLELKTEREKAEERARNLATVNDISQMISSTLNLEEVLRLAVTTAGEILDAHQCVLMLVEKGGGHIRSKYEYSQGKPQTKLINVHISLEHYPEFRQAIKTQKPVVVQNAQRDPLMQDMEDLLVRLDIRSILVFPLMLEGEVLGLLALRWREKPHLFKKEEIHLGEIIANQIAIALKNAQLFTKERELEQMKNEFTSMVVHDLKNPLAAITGFSDLLMRKVVKENRTQDERYLRNILYYANLLLGLVHNILAIHKIEEGNLTLQEETMLLAQLIQTAVSQFEVLAEEEGIAVVTEVSDHLPSVRADSQLFIRLLANILHNGIKQTPRGGKITLRVEEREGGELCLTIQDTGTGIPAAYVDKIFDKFVQVESRRTGAGVSVGLGLYFCKLAIEAHGGQIWVESQEGRGSTFYLTLPANRVIK